MRLILWLILGYVLYMTVKGFLANREKQVGQDSSAKGEDTHRDPICGTYVAEGDAVIGRVEGERIYFCSMACLDKYREQLEHPPK